MRVEPTGESLTNALAEGVLRFNRGDFWGAHESWEHMWLALKGPFRDFIRGLIQLAAAFHHIKRGNQRGAERLFRSSLERLARFPEGTAGVLFHPAAATAREVQEHSRPGPPALELMPEWRELLRGELDRSG